MAGKPTEGCKAAKGIKRAGNWGGRMQSVSTGTCSILFAVKRRCIHQGATKEWKSERRSERWSETRLSVFEDAMLP